ncbi:MAG: flagellar basal body P-ring formation chaperone FlgA [Tepidisphaeraceae bacterium]|jgi:flagella basal body P-ring formation protein FlgA
MNTSPDTTARFVRKMALVLASVALWICRPPFVLAQDDTDAYDTPQANPAQAETAVSLESQPETEKFVPDSTVNLHSFAGGSLVLRGDATVPTGAVKVKNICRWPDADAPFFAPVADLTVVHLPPGRPYGKVTIDQVRDTLRDAGMNIALVDFGGAATCAVTESGEQIEEQTALADWADSASQQAIAAGATFPMTQPSSTSAAIVAASPIRSLRQILTDDLCRRDALAPDSVEITFNSADDKVLNLAEPYFTFEVTPRQVRALANLAWDVTIVAGAERHKAMISASARVWQTETILEKPLAYGQIIGDGDLQEKRVLTDQTIGEPLLTKDQAVGQGASRDLKPGTVLTSSMVDPALLARPGQLITINVVHGSFRITAVAKAIEGGSMGQTIRARSDVDPTQQFEVTLTGPQQGVVTGSGAENQLKNPSPIAAAAN